MSIHPALGLSEDCSTCPIQERAVCAHCNPPELSHLNEVKFYRIYEAGQTIALRGDPVDVFASVVSGTATLERVAEDGRTQVLGVLLPADFIGRPGRKTLNYDVNAVSEVRLCCFRRKPFEALLEEMPHLSERLLDMAFDELDAARDWMNYLGRGTAREKIAGFFVYLAKRSLNGVGPAPDAKGCQFSLPVSREQIANFTGLTIETVSRQITNLRRDGVIHLQGSRSVDVPDLARLRAEAGDDAEI